MAAKEKIKVYKYQVPADLAPGVFRAGVGFFRPGAVLKLPDLASFAFKKRTGIEDAWNAKLQPLDKAAYDELKRQHPKAVIKPVPSRQDENFVEAPALDEAEGAFVDA